MEIFSIPLRTRARVSPLFLFPLFSPVIPYSLFSLVLEENIPNAHHCSEHFGGTGYTQWAVESVSEDGKACCLNASRPLCPVYTRLNSDLWVICYPGWILLLIHVSSVVTDTHDIYTKPEHHTHSVLLRLNAVPLRKFLPVRKQPPISVMPDHVFKVRLGNLAVFAAWYLWAEASEVRACHELSASAAVLAWRWLWAEDPSGDTEPSECCENAQVSVAGILGMFQSVRGK